MKRTFGVVVSSLVVTGSAFATFYWCSRPLLRIFRISEYANGIALVALLFICIGCVLIGTTVGLFLFPLVLRPFVSPAEFWAWFGRERGVVFPLLNRVLERWAALLYGQRTSVKVVRGN
jgi:hypothetical protein